MDKHWCKSIAEASAAERLEKMQVKQRWRDAWRKVKGDLIEDAQRARERQRPWEK